MSAQMLGRVLAGGLDKSRTTGSLRLRFAVVHAVTASPASLDLYIDGSPHLTPAVSYLASYTPTAGDTVAVLEQPTQRGPDYLVVGKTA